MDRRRKGMQAEDERYCRWRFRSRFAWLRVKPAWQERRRGGHVQARLSRFAGLDPERVEETVDQFKAQALPQLEQQPGFRGITVGVNRKTGQAVAISLWETEADMRESEKLADEARDRAVSTARPSREPIVDHYEIIVHQ
jgi:heme-degrading monooxygenase HmoA